MKNNQKRRLLPGEYLIAAVLAGAIIFGVWFAMHADEKKRKSVEGTYSCEYALNGSEDNSIVVYYKFDAQKGTYEELWGERSLMTGSYTVDDDTVTLVSDGKEEIGAESETIKFLIKDNLLIAQDYIYKGSLPSDDTFDAECTMADTAGQEYAVRFSKDGTYTYIIKGTDGREGHAVTGTYKREGDFLHRTNADGGPMTDFYIYNGKLAGIFYTKE